MIFRATPASVDRYVLAEGPVWDAATARVLWVDIEAGALLSGELAADGTVSLVDRWHLDRYVGAVALASDPLIAGHHSLFTLSGIQVAPVIPPGVDSRLNDGACDPWGRFLVGTLSLDSRTSAEFLYRLRPDGTLEVLDSGVGLSNGLAWSPDGSLFYSIDTSARTVWVRDYSPDGEVGPRRVCLSFPDVHPDGMCVDTDGNLWVALFGAGEVRRYSPAGDHLDTVLVDAPHTTSVAFVGPALDRLLITTGRSSGHPDSGRLFTAFVPARGLPTPIWNPRA